MHLTRHGAGKEMTMNRYVTVDTNSGYVWWVGDAESPEEACTKTDLETNLEASVYEQTNTDHADGFFVYTAPANFDCADGRDQASIDAVSAFPRVGRFVKVRLSVQGES